jgi:ABC-type transport system involved in cytochrome c biogenesis permease subunit
MDILIGAIIAFYLVSSMGYITFLFIQKDYLQKTAFYLLMAGFFCHSIAIGYGYFEIEHVLGQFPVANLYETLLLVGWAISGVIAAQLPKASVQVQNLFNSFWLIFHIISIFIGEAIFALACGIGILYLLQEHEIKTKNHGFFFKRLPSLELLDSTGYACIVAGFTLLTIGLITGMVYAKFVWGKFWSWDPKEVWSAISWLLYAILLHQRITIGFRGRRAAIMAIMGFGALLFTFIGVNFFLKGHHEPFTRW